MFSFNFASSRYLVPAPSHASSAVFLLLLLALALPGIVVVVVYSYLHYSRETARVSASKESVQKKKNRGKERWRGRNNRKVLDAGELYVAGERCCRARRGSCTHGCLRSRFINSFCAAHSRPPKGEESAESSLRSLPRRGIENVSSSISTTPRWRSMRPFFFLL